MGFGVFNSRIDFINSIQENGCILLIDTASGTLIHFIDTLELILYAELETLQPTWP